MDREQKDAEDRDRKSREHHPCCAPQIHGQKSNPSLRQELDTRSGIQIAGVTPQRAHARFPGLCLVMPQYT
jgi:hypothetical protein